MQRKPKVTVLLPVYNGDRYLSEALGSILAQTFTDFELLVVDDGSTDRTPEILAACRDPRLRVVQNQGNQGVVAALNRGLALARGDYVARMDSDDVSLPDRLAAQIAFLDASPDVWLCGSWYRIGSPGSGEGTLVEVPSDHGTLKAAMLFINPVGHPTVAFRRQRLREADLWYDDSFRHAEDYDLWTRIAAFPGAGIATVPKYLLWYRWHGENVGQRHAQVQYENSVRIRRRLLAALGLHPDKNLLAVHEYLARGNRVEHPDFPAMVEAWTGCLLAANRRVGLYDEQALSVVLAAKMRHALQHAQ